MATLTAQILVGSSHPNHGGIAPSHYLFLSENSRPAWMLVRQNLFSGKGAGGGRITWIPTVEDMLEDGLLMVAVHAVKVGPVIDLMKEYRPRIRPLRLEMYEDFEPAQRQALYRACREHLTAPKLIVSVFEGSSIARRLSILKKYMCEIEVCKHA